MKFSEIKNKIKNLGNYKSLSEIKKDNLRICRNAKYGDYWLIEQEFLKPVVADYDDCENSKIIPNMVLFSFPERDYKKTVKHACRYIEWGSGLTTKGRQKQESGLSLSETSTLKNKKYWYSFCPPEILSDLFWQKRTGERFAVFYSENKMYSDQKFYPFISYSLPKNKLIVSLNSIVQRLFLETLSISYTGAFTLIEISVEDVENLPCINPDLIKEVDPNKINTRFQSIFKELGVDKDADDFENLNPSKDRKFIDDIVFDVIGLNDEERKRTYISVLGQVKNRLKKSSSLENN